MTPPRKILVLNGHPMPGAFCAALAETAASSARTAGAEVKQVALADLSFDPVLHHGYHQKQELEPDLEALWEDLLWCDHLILVHPMWWGSAPALLKGLFDRLLLPGRAFRYVEGKPLPEGLLKGRTSDLILTSDTPGFYFALAYRRAWISTLKRQILGFCGMRLKRVLHLSPQRGKDDSARAGMITRTADFAAKAAQL